MISDAFLTLLLGWAALFAGLSLGDRPEALTLLWLPRRIMLFGVVFIALRWWVGGYA